MIDTTYDGQVFYVVLADVSEDKDDFVVDECTAPQNLDTCLTELACL